MTTTTYSIVEPTTDSELAEYYKVRYEILRKPWGQPMHSTKDDTETISVHLLVKDEAGNGIGSGRMQFNSETEAQIRSMAVRDEYQGKGIGKKVIQELERIARARNIKLLCLDSRENAVEFYKKNGFQITAPSYLLFGVIQHYRMEKGL